LIKERHFMDGEKKLEVIPGIDKVFLLQCLQHTVACFDVGFIDLDHCALSEVLAMGRSLDG